MSRSVDRLTHSSHWGAFEAVVHEGRLVDAKPLASDRDPSPILGALPAMVHSPLRVTRPMFRRGWLEGGPGGAKDRRGSDTFVALAWDDALERVAGEIDRIRSVHGNAALFTGSYGWCSAGRFHHAKTQMQRFFNLIGGSTTQLDSYSFAAAQVLLPRVIGTLDPLIGPLTSWDGIVADTRLMVCFGGVPMKNAQVESGGTAEHATGSWLRRAVDGGVGFVNVSPLRDDIPSWARADWIPIRPGTDTAMLLAMAYVLLDENLHDADFLQRCCVGFEPFAAYLRGDAGGIARTPQWAAAITGVPAQTIATLARKMASCRTMINLAWALQRADHGEQPYWAAIALAAMLGQIGLPGGGFGFGYGAESGMGNPRRPIANPTHRAGRNPLDSTIPVARIADMLLQPGARYAYNGTSRTYPDIRLVYWCGGNPFHHHQDLNRLVQAFQRPDTVIVNECWWTATARHADIVLPATTTLERNDIGAAARDRHLIAMKQAVSPVGDARSDYDILRGLAQRMGVADAFTEGRSELEWVRHLYETARVAAQARDVELPDFDRFWAEGAFAVPAPAEPFTLFAAFRREPGRHPLRTPSGKIELFSATIAGFGYDDCPGHPAWLEPYEWLGAARASAFPLHLVSNQPSTRLHSQMDAAGPSKAAKIRDREPIRLSRADAAHRALTDGDIVRVWNDRGQVLAAAVIDDAVMPGVVQLATGAWYDPETPLGLDKHGNPNVLTADRGTSRLAQGPTAHSCLVQVERWTDPLPAVTAHRAPPSA